MPTRFLSFAAVFVVLFLILKGAHLRRQYYRFKAREVLAIEGAYLIGVGVSAVVGRPGFEPILWGLVASFVVYMRLPRRSRHIPASVRRKVVARYEFKTGKKYNSRTHEIDHVVPFSRGGSHTEDNLQVVGKRKNRSKGARSPWWDVLGR